MKGKVKKKTKEDLINEAHGQLLAAEAEFLHACGWFPFTRDGKVGWKDPTEKRIWLYAQDEAVTIAKKRRPT